MKKNGDRFINSIVSLQYRHIEILLSFTLLVTTPRRYRFRYPIMIVRI
jgi:hypothetical protein